MVAQVPRFGLRPECSDNALPKTYSPQSEKGCPNPKARPTGQRLGTSEAGKRSGHYAELPWLLAQECGGLDHVKYQEIVFLTCHAYSDEYWPEGFLE
jgi:hypothetical protein